MKALDAKTSNPREGGPTFPLRQRLLRLAWGLAWAFLGVWTPVPCHAWRRFLLRCFGAKIDRRAFVYPSASVWYPPNLQMAPYACLGPRVNCYCMDRVIIEDYAVVSQRASLCAGTHDIDDADFPLVTRPIHVQRHAWIAAEAFVGPGVTVGEGAVLGARGVTVKNLDSWTVYAGNPAVRIRMRRRTEEDVHE